MSNSFQSGDVAFLSRPGSAYGLRSQITHSRDVRMVRIDFRNETGVIQSFCPLQEMAAANGDVLGATPEEPISFTNNHHHTSCSLLVNEHL